jgi:hypothetical protein
MTPFPSTLTSLIFINASGQGRWQYYEHALTCAFAMARILEEEKSRGAGG